MIEEEKTEVEDCSGEKRKDVLEIAVEKQMAKQMTKKIEDKQ